MALAMYGGYDGGRGPPRAGIGAQGAAQNLPVPNLAGANGNSDAGPAPAEKFSLFVSGIPASLSDARLQQVLETVGPVLNVRRIRDAAGVPKGFAFAEYGDAEAVLRCLELLNGVTIIGQDREQKTLTIKADAKLRSRLDEHEAGRMKTSTLDDQTAFARDTLQDLLEAIRKNPTEGDETQDDDVEYNPDGTKKYKIPSHLQDLGPDDLPEESRGLITSEIALFRERAAKREEQKRLAEANRNRSRQDDLQRRDVRRPEPSQASPRMEQSRGWGNSQPPAQSRQWGGNQQALPTGPASAGPDAQYNRATGFVASSSNQPAPQSGMSDEDAERMRQQRKREEKEREYRARLSRWETRERGKLQGLEKDKQAKYFEQQDNDRRRQMMLEKCANFDDDEEAERGDELFVVDRTRWRKARRAARQKEIEQDARDAKLEAEQAEALKRESEDFLNRQAALFASMSGSLATNPDATAGEPKKLKLLAPTAKADTEAEKARTKPKAVAVFAGADEDEDAGKKKRELIPLDYSDDEDSEKKAEKKKKKVKELVAAIPNDKESLWSYHIHWEKFNEAMVKEKLRPFAAKKSVEYLGSEEEEVIDTVIENMRAHKGPQELADELEPVLAEEAEEFVIKVYRMLNFELLSALHGVKL